MAMEAQPEDRGVTVMERVRAVHLRMVDAVLGGDGLEGVATLAAGETGGVVAIVVPRLGAAAASAPVAELPALRRYVGERARGRAAGVPPGVVAEVPIATGDEQLGAVLLLGDDDPLPDALEFLHVAAVACLTEVAVEEARLEVEQNLRGSFLEELRGRDDLEADEVLRRAARLGCDLSRGAVALCAELSSDRPRHVVATIAGEHPGALAQHMDGGGGSGRERPREAPQDVPGAAPAHRRPSHIQPRGIDVVRFHHDLLQHRHRQSTLELFGTGDWTQRIAPTRRIGLGDRNHEERRVGLLMCASDERCGPALAVSAQGAERWVHIARRMHDQHERVFLGRIVAVRDEHVVLEHQARPWLGVLVADVLGVRRARYAERTGQR